MTNLFGKKTVLVLLVVAVVAGLAFFGIRATSKSGDGRGFGQVERKDLLQRVTIAGQIAPFRKTIITAPYNGYVKKLYVRIGEVVKQGEPIVAVVQSLQNDESTFPLRAPVNGRVVQIEKAEGEFARENDVKDFILRIDDTSRLFILANAPEIDRLKIKIGQEAVVKASAVVTRTYKGLIREMSLAAREKEQWNRSQVVEFPIRIEVTERDEQLMPGMSVVIDIITAKKEKVLMIRHDLVRRDGEKYYVVMAGGGRRDIKVGMQNEEGFEVLEGLREGDKVKQVSFVDAGGGDEP